MRIQINNNTFFFGKELDLDESYGVAIAYYCNTCGTEQYAKWLWSLEDNEEDLTLHKTIESFRKLKHCTVCGAPFSYGKGFYHESEWDEDYNQDEFFEEMKEIRRKDTKKTTSKMIKELVEQYNDSYIKPTNLPSPETIKRSPEELKKYLSTILQIEANIYSLSERLCDLYIKQNENNKFIVSEKSVPSMELQKKLDEAEKKYKIAIQTAQLNSANITMDKVYVPAGNAPTPPTEPKAPVLEKPGFFNKKKVLEQNKLLTEQYEAAYAKYKLAYNEFVIAINEYNRQRTQKIKELEEAAKTKYEQQIEIAKAERKILISNAEKEYENTKAAIAEQLQLLDSATTPGILIKNMIDREIKTAETTLKESIECKNKLYDCDVIFEKYRNVVAVSMFCEYISSGRCDTLEGKDGTYNLYESEIRANIVISNLSKIVDSLEKIKENQYMIYSKLDAIERSLSRLNSCMYDATQSLEKMDKQLGKIEENSKVIAYNTQATAYYSKMTAELTNSLGYLVAMN